MGISIERSSAPTTQDSYGGLSWAQRAAYGYLAGVLDPADAGGRKNAYIDTLHKRALARALIDQRYRKALDFGCGTGRFLKFLAARSDQVYALDRTPEMLAIARSQYCMPLERFIENREAVLPFADETFDLILSVYVISCAPHSDFDGLVGELQRVCSKGGTIALIEQVDNERHLAPATFEAPFLRAGFDILSKVAIRRSSSRQIKLAQRPWVTGSLRGLLAAWEIASMAQETFSVETKGYWDYLLVAKKLGHAKP